jgi:hypothetical protein
MFAHVFETFIVDEQCFDDSNEELVMENAEILG